MKDKINVAELLRNCPTGMELDCSMYDNLYFDTLNADYYGTINCYTLNDGIKTYINFTKYGTFNNHIGAKCVIFPKGKTSWEGFQRPFEPGDIVITNSNEHAFIYSGENDNYWESYCGVYCGTRNICINSKVWSDKKHKLRLATKGEKEKLYQVIKDNGYKWNEETKTLERLFPYNIGTKVWVKSDKEHEYIHTIVGISRNSLGNLEYEVKEEKTGIVIHYPKELLIPITTKEPKFKVGDKVKHKCDKNNTIITITGSKHDCYYIQYYNNNKNEYQNESISFTDQDKYELVIDKFDITNLKPFDKVLVRDGNDEVWVNAFFGFCDTVTYKTCIFVTGNENWCQCIPYEGNEHLLGTTDDCDDYFKTWQK